MSREGPGLRRALGELEEIQKLASERPSPLRVEASKQLENGLLAVEVSLDCENVAVTSGLEPFAARERVVLLISPFFPFDRPLVRVAHERFAGLPYVLGGHEICLYRSEADWNPADGMFGFIARLAAWYQRAARGDLVQAGQPLHPPLAYPLGRNPECVVVRPDLPRDFVPGGAILVRCHSRRADVVEWLRPDEVDVTSQAAVQALRTRLRAAADRHQDRSFLGAVHILHAPLTFEFPETLPELAAAFAAQGVSRDELLERLGAVGLANALTTERTDEPMPLHVVVGAPMRGFADGGPRLMHLAVWELGGREALIPSSLAFQVTGDEDLAARLRAARDRADEWLRTAPVSWARVQEARPQIVTRRDTGKPAEWLRGKSVLVLGCGALGSRIAEHCVRAGVGKLVVADSDKVSPGVLVRQPYEDADIGHWKAERLAQRLTSIWRQTGTKVEAATRDVRLFFLANDVAHADADLIVDATANRGASACIEWFRRTQQRRPPILTLGVGHDCERAIGALALPHATGAGADILHSFADKAVTEEELRDAAEDFFPEPDTQQPFQPEIGCSEPTFAGSDPEAAAAAAQVFTWSLRLLRDHAVHRPVAPKSLFLARMPGDRGRPAHVYVDWPNDVTADDPDSGYQVRIRPQAMAGMRAEALTTARLCPRSFETGGIMLGYFDDACGVVWVTAAEGPSPDSERGRHSFRHGTKDVKERVAWHHARSRGRERFIGMWHTHPGTEAEASWIDHAAMAGLLESLPAKGAGRRALLLILGGQPGRWSRWLRGAGRPEVHTRLFSRTEILAARDAAATSQKGH